MKRLFVFALLCCLSISLLACSNTSTTTEGNGTDSPFRIGAIPDQSAAELNENMKKMAEYLTEKSGVDVEYIPSQDYAALVTAFERGEIHMAWFGGLTSVQARNRVPEAASIVQRPLDAAFHCVYIAQKDLNLNGLEDLAGKTFTFGSESSTSGHLMPRYFLNEAGIIPEDDFDGGPNYSGSHDRTYALVESGAFDAGVLNESLWEMMVESGEADLDKIEAFYISDDYYNYNWTINSEAVLQDQFGYDIKAEMKDILLTMHEDTNSDLAADILAFYDTHQFIPTQNENYSMIETIGRDLGLLN